MKSTLLVATVLLAASAAAHAQRLDIHLEPQPEMSGGCPARLVFRSEIRTFEPGQPVTYEWLRSDGAHSTHSITFGRPGPHAIRDTWTLSGNFNGWERLVIVAPRDEQTIESRFTVHCGRH